MFVPKGYLPLTTAVDQLAAARRPAGQTNDDDGKYAARAELRAELHSGSISTAVVSPSSGKTFEMSVDRRSRQSFVGYAVPEGARHDFRKPA